jgi:septum formation protein
LLILASKSAIRHALLRDAGIAHVPAAAEFDEAPLKAAHRGEALVRLLAEGKAKAASAAADDWVIGADSSVEVDGVRYSKPATRDEAARHLAAFSGRTMQLASGVALVRDGEVAWSHAETAHLAVRELSAGFIESYLDAEWPEVGHCVGVFRMEGRGVTLFEQVEGSHFTILGLPLLALLGALRERGIVAS